MRNDPTVAALRAAVKGLTYESESDEPYKVFTWPAGDVGDLSRETVLSLGGHAAGEHVDEQTTDDFFAPLVRHEDWHGAEERRTVERYRTLRDTVARLLDRARVYKVGGGPEKAVYVVGKARSGIWAGIKTTAVET